MRSVPPRGSVWVFGFSIFDCQLVYRQTPIANRQLTIGNQETHPLPRQNVLDAARQFAPDGLDAALVTAGGEETDEALLAIRHGGRIAYPHGVMPEPTAHEGVAIEAYDGENTPALIDRLNTLIDSGPFEVHVDRTFRLEEAGEAHKALTEHHLGKLALRVE